MKNIQKRIFFFHENKLLRRIKNVLKTFQCKTFEKEFSYNKKHEKQFQEINLNFIFFERFLIGTHTQNDFLKV